MAAELEKREQSSKVYPMGFIPQVKQDLLQTAEENLQDLKGFSDISLRLRSAIETLANEDENSIQPFLDAVRDLDHTIAEGEIVHQEERDFITHALRTDEELAVIFAKISRNPGSFDEIARSVTEEGAEKFHQKWTVSVEGYGHASVAEHAIMHMAVENIPSLDGDQLIDNRLASYTEFSARFKGRQGVSFYTPEAVSRDQHLSCRWNSVHTELFSTHDLLMEKGEVYINTQEAKEKHPMRKLTRKTVADQFKNLMPASRLTSMGVTMNAREAESTIRKLLSSPYESVRNLGQMYKDQSLVVAPTLVKYAEANEYLIATRKGISTMVDQQRELHGNDFEIDEQNGLVDLIQFDKRADDKFIAACLYKSSKTGTFKGILNEVSTWTFAQKKEAVGVALGDLGRWDTPIRELEMPDDYIVEYPAMTYGDWREYERHRMQSYFAKPFDVQWGYMIPALAKEMDESKDSQFHGSVDAIKGIMGKVDDLFNEVSKIDPYAAHYAVTRLHYRPAVAKFNIREAFHLIGLRTGPTAHPFIRRLMWPTFDQIRQVQPIIMEHLGLRVEREGRPSRDFVWTY